MLYEEVEQSRLWQRLGEMLQHLACNEVAASTRGGEGEGGLLYHTCAKVRIFSLLSLVEIWHFTRLALPL